MEETRERLSRIDDRLEDACRRAGRPREDVLLLAVVKKRPLETVRQLYELGVTHLAENRVQEARERIPQLPDGIAWHFVGPLQKNKAKYLPGLVQWVHSVEKLDVAEALQKAFAKRPELPPLEVLVQFNIAGEEQKHGAARDEAAELVRAVSELDRLRVQGLMTMAPYSDDPEVSRPVFRKLRLLRDELQERIGLPLPHLSMGMTNDFEVAVEEGATIVRIGTALFEG